MKRPVVILALVAVLVGLALIWNGRKQPKSTPAPASNSAAIQALPSPVVPSQPAVSSAVVTTPATPPTPATAAAAVAPAQTVAIQDGKTLDFSSGKPVLKDSADEKAIIEQALKEMNEAAAGVTFGPVPKAPAPDTKKPAPQE